MVQRDEHVRQREHQHRDDEHVLVEGGARCGHRGEVCVGGHAREDEEGDDGGVNLRKDSGGTLITVVKDKSPSRVFPQKQSTSTFTARLQRSSALVFTFATLLWIVE